MPGFLNILRALFKLMSAAKCSNCGTVDGGDSRAAEQLALDIALGTHYHRLLTTNEVPESSDIAFMQTVVSKTDPRLASLEIEISRLRDRLKQLEEEQTLLSRYHAQNQAILSPLWSTSSPQTLLFRCFFPRTSSPTITSLEYKRLTVPQGTSLARNHYLSPERRPSKDFAAPQRFCRKFWLYPAKTLPLSVPQRHHDYPDPTDIPIHDITELASDTTPNDFADTLISWLIIHNPGGDAALSPHLSGIYVICQGWPQFRLHRLRSLPFHATIAVEGGRATCSVQFQSRASSIYYRHGVFKEPVLYDLERARGREHRRQRKIEKGGGTGGARCRRRAGDAGNTAERNGDVESEEERAGRKGWDDGDEARESGGAARDGRKRSASRVRKGWREWDAGAGGGRGECGGRWEWGVGSSAVEGVEAAAARDHGEEGVGGIILSHESITAGTDHPLPGLHLIVMSLVSTVKFESHSP
ncbi:hypothetical protein DFH09DRAFT_1093425 [Mycena vulgaris]|nr:hypothetical protein DFH09DRAFT_1093425 [Mycena vulgaris]